MGRAALRLEHLSHRRWRALDQDVGLPVALYREPRAQPRRSRGRAVGSVEPTAAGRVLWQGRAAARGIMGGFRRPARGVAGPCARLVRAVTEATRPGRATCGFRRKCPKIEGFPAGIKPGAALEGTPGAVQRQRTNLRIVYS